MRLSTFVAAALAAPLLALFLLSTPAGALALRHVLEAAGGASTPEELASAQAIVLVGGRTARVHSAARLQQQTRLPILVTGKGSGDAPFDAESEKMAQILRDDYRIDARWVETASLDTTQNARFSWCLVGAQGIRRVALVTDPRHMLRARAAFAAAGFDVLPAPTADEPPAPSWTWDDLRPQREVQPASARALLEWAGAAAMAWDGLTGAARAQKCPSSSALTATKVQTEARNRNQGPGTAPGHGNSSNAVMRRESSQSRPSEGLSIRPPG